MGVHRGMTPDKPMDLNAVETLIGREIRDALDYVNGSDAIGGQRDRNLEYYRGEMTDLPAPKGRSAITDRTVANYINMMLPSLLRVFTSGKNIAEYAPSGAEPIELLRTATRFINDVVFRKDNRGEVILYQWAFDALVQKVGVVKAVWEEKYETKTETFAGLSDLEFQALLFQRPNDEVVAHSGQSQIVTGPDGIAVESVTHDVTIATKVNRSTVRIYNIPPEEFIISRNARDDEDFVIKSHRTKRLVGDLVASGYPLEILEKLPDYQPPVNTTSGENRYQNDYSRNQASASDPMLREVVIHDGIVKCDPDGKGVREWYFVAGGDESKVNLLEFEEYKCQVVFAEFCPNPLPHSFYGLCPTDDLAELQKVCTVLIRQMLDNLYLSNTPQREVLQRAILKPDQLMNMAPGAPVLVSEMNAIREMAIPFVADKALIALQHFDQQAEMRSGVSKNAMGLNPEALTNQSATAANLAYSASMGKVEMIAKLWATGGMRKLFRGILKILAEYQDFARVAQVSGQPMQVDPREWRSLVDADVVVNTGLGTGTRERDVAMLQIIAQDQDDIMETLGPENPIASFREWVATKQRLIESAGLSNSDQYIKMPPENWQWPQPQPPQPTPDTQLLAKVEQGKTAAKLNETEAEIKSKEVIELAKIESDERIALAKIQADASKLRVDMVNAETKHLTLRESLKAKQAKTSASEAKAQGAVERVGRGRKADERADQRHRQLLDALSGMASAVGQMNKPKRIVKDPKTGEKRVEVVN
jgi:hypothetical protein